MKQFAVIGIGRFGGSLASTLYEMGHEVLAIDKDEETIQNIADKVTYAIQADGTDEKALKDVGLRNVDVVIVAVASDIQASIMTTLNAKELGIKRVYAKASDFQHRKLLYKIGADKVFLPERDMGVRVANNLVSNNIFELIELDNDHSIMEINVYPEWIDKSLLEVKFRAKYGLNIIAIKRGAKLNISPLANDRIKKDDILVVVGKNKDIKKLRDNG